MARRVLLIEDEDDIREVASTALSVLGGFSVATAASGSEGLAMAAAPPQPDGILLDVMLPGLDGRETLRRLRSEPATASIPVVFLTASVQTGDMEALRALACDGVISKPFDPVALPDQVREVFGWS